MSLSANTEHVQELKDRQRAPLSTPTDLTAEATQDVTGALNAILPDDERLRAMDVIARHLETVPSAVGQDL